MKTSFLVSTVILLAAASAPAYAQIYKWVDESGRTHYSDKAPQSAKRVDAVADRVSTYSAPEAPAALPQPNAPVNAALLDQVDRLERQLNAEQAARRDAELAAYSQSPQDLYYVPVAVGGAFRGRGDHFRPFRGPKAPGVVGPGIMPGTFNGPNAITAGNVTLRTSLPAVRGRGAATF
ncbi:MAG TPA: DUF4124 domain-containing protein [Burkholderiales bacterium]|nr:DUF4124 domain-containing protein [Burkholderiales bacterium]